MWNYPRFIYRNGLLMNFKFKKWRSRCCQVNWYIWVPRSQLISRQNAANVEWKNKKIERALEMSSVPLPPLRAVPERQCRGPFSIGLHRLWEHQTIGFMIPSTQHWRMGYTETNFSHWIPRGPWLWLVIEHTLHDKSSAETNNV